MKRVVVDEPAVGLFVKTRAKAPYNPAEDHTIGVVDDSYPPGSPGWVRGGIIYTAYTGVSVWVHIASLDEKWLTREMVFLGFQYPFEQLGCGVIYGIIAADNEPGLQFDLNLGFREHCRLPGMFASGDGLIVFMRRDDCRFLRRRPAGGRLGWERG